MRYLLATLLIFGLMQNVPAQSVEAMETCKQYSLFAKSIMESRQNGASMSRLMEVVNRDDDHSEEVKQVVIRAFEESM